MLTKFYIKPMIALFSLCLYDSVTYPFKISSMCISTCLNIPRQDFKKEAILSRKQSQGGKHPVLTCCS